MDWSEILQERELIVWQGRPAPRCFTFRNWPHSIFGAVLLLASTCWFLFGVQLGNEHQQIIYAFIPVPFLLAV